MEWSRFWLFLREIPKKSVNSSIILKNFRVFTHHQFVGMHASAADRDRDRCAMGKINNIGHVISTKSPKFEFLWI